MRRIRTGFLRLIEAIPPRSAGAISLIETDPACGRPTPRATLDFACPVIAIQPAPAKPAAAKPASPADPIGEAARLGMATAALGLSMASFPFLVGAAFVRAAIKAQHHG